MSETQEDIRSIPRHSSSPVLHSTAFDCDAVVGVFKINQTPQVVLEFKIDVRDKWHKILHALNKRQQNVKMACVDHCSGRSHYLPKIYICPNFDKASISLVTLKISRNHSFFV
ncbi:hypothetical protein CEXT_333791 [Caerostris extrusa]|uniref:Uncharacterized protein n=1 Tax=Caerostris extrusa TaxID=172846 RepID=A0AAV4VAQ6_CAEEX|nr:hypothetical protein CEXT_333791 [Caerostris extrusa]